MVKEPHHTFSLVTRGTVLHENRKIQSRNVKFWQFMAMVFYQVLIHNSIHTTMNSSQSGRSLNREHSKKPTDSSKFQGFLRTSFPTFLTLKSYNPADRIIGSTAKFGQFWIIIFSCRIMHIVKAKSVMSSLEQEQVEVLDWPAQSPDLNPTENLWKTLGEMVVALNPTNTEDLSTKLQHEWNKIDVNLCLRLIHS